MAKQELPGITDIEVVGEGAEQNISEGGALDLSKMNLQKEFRLSRIDVSHQLEATNEDTINPDAFHEELSKTGINIVEFSTEEKEKFNLEGTDHPLHKEHLASAA